MKSALMVSQVKQWVSAFGKLEPNLYIQYMKSNRDDDTDLRQSYDIDALRTMIKKEKEALLSMFLANASNTTLSGQYKIIEELTEKVSQHNRS